MYRCEYCDEWFKNINLHITKSHTKFIKVWNMKDKKLNDMIELQRQINDGPIEKAIQDKCASEHFYFPSDVKKTKYYDTTDDAFYGIYYGINYKTKQIVQCVGYTCGFTRSGKCKTSNIKNQVNVIKINIKRN